MNNNCIDCQRAEEQYRIDNPSPTGGQSVNPLDLLCEKHRKDKIDSGDYSPINIPMPEK